MICLICRQAKVVNGFTSVNFQRAEMRLTVNNIPAQVCRSCGEAYVDEGVAARLLQSVEKVYEAGLLEDVIEYEGFI